MLLQTAICEREKMATFTGLLLLLSLSVGHAAEESNPTCRLYLAPSHTSIKDAGGQDTVRYALFAGIDFATNQTLPGAELAIPFVDFVDGPLHDPNPDFFKHFEKFIWTADHAGTAKWEVRNIGASSLPF
jgi:hypothetical protein